MIKTQGALRRLRANDDVENTMRMMNRIPALARPCALLFITATFVAAQDPAPATAPAPAPQVAPEEFRALRQAIEQQTKQLETLNEQLTEINRRLATSPHQAQPTPTPAPPSPPTLGTSTPAPTPPAASAPATASSAPGPGAPAPSPAEAGKPEAAAADGVKHTVAKGETLTSIAKRYNIPLAELEKANKITDERKLQIGQVLNIPTAANKTPETPTEKKETP